jgi:hypothetical protein
VGFTLVLALPCAVAFLIVPDLIMRALFARAPTGLLAVLPHWRDETLLDQQPMGARCSRCCGSDSRGGGREVWWLRVGAAFGRC